ncbi:MAG: rhomboid family intramembrane serine protease [Acidobacteria bacterium]|nr:rhomboid family intramembrane serine protease [Acidobacteriota bacterium]
MFPLKDTQPSAGTPVTTILLIAVTAAVFLFELSLDPYSRNHLISSYGLVADRFEAHALVTSLFLHGGWLHILGNLWFLWIFGDNVEDVLGHGRFLAFYLICGALAGLAHVAFNPYSRAPMVGASGAIAGVMGAYLVKFPRARVLTLVLIVVFFTVVELPAVLLLAFWFLVQLLSGLGSIGYSHLSQGGVAWFAHAGGFLAGVALIGWMAKRRPYARRADLSW